MKVSLLAFALHRGFTMNDLSQQLLSCRLGDESENGFEIERATRDLISGVYLSRRTKKINIRLPDGSLEVLTRDSIERCDFEISKKEGRLLVFEPGRELRSFVSAVSSASRFKVRIEPYDTRIDLLANHFEAGDLEFKVVKIFLDGVKFARRISGALVADGDLTSQVLRGSIGNLRGKVTRVELSWPDHSTGHNVSLCIADSGKFEIRKCDSSHVAKSIVEDVLRSMRQ